MDVRAFSADSFDVREWINQAFRSPEAQKQTKEQYATSLVMKLQLLIAKLSVSLEEQSDQVCLSMPKVLREAEGLQQEALLLQSKMSAVQEEIDKVNTETGSSMEALVQMDQLKGRIQAVCKALKEADNWTILSTEIEDALDNGDLSVIAEKLTGIQSSLKILAHVPDYDERVMHVEGLKNRLEALGSPELVAAFNANDAEKARFFVRIFSGMERNGQLLKYYRKCLKARVLKSWERTVNEHQHETVLEWTKYFFAESESMVKDQQAWFQSVFVSVDSSEHILQSLLEAYAGLDPRLDFCLEAGLKQHQEQLDFLIEVKETVDAHVQNLDELLCSADSGNHSSAAPRELAKALYAPFKPHVARYGRYEAARLKSEISEAAPTSSSKDILDEMRGISVGVPKVASIFERASKRCCKLTEGCAYSQLKSALEDALSAYLDRFTGLGRRLDRRKAAANSWNVMQHSLTLNQTTGDLLLSLEQLDITLSMDFLDRTKDFLGPDARDRAFAQFHLFLMDTKDIASLEKFYVHVRQGTNYPLLGDALKLTSKMCVELQNCTFNIIFHPIQEELNSVPSLELWSSASAGSESTQSDMPLFGFSPQEYITQIGQYLMTLPQHLEPYMTNENVALARAFKERVFPYCSSVSETVEQNPADFILSCVARATCQGCQIAVLKIPKLTANSTKQLAMDIGYLGDILSDLGHPLSDGLQAALTLLKTPREKFREQAAGMPQKIASSIAHMRGFGNL